MNRHLNFLNMTFMKTQFISFDYSCFMMNFIPKNSVFFVVIHKNNLTLMSLLMTLKVKWDLDTFFVTVLTCFPRMLGIICTKFSKMSLFPNM